MDEQTNGSVCDAPVFVHGECNNKQKPRTNY